MAPQSVDAAGSPQVSNAYVPRIVRDDHGMRMVELLVAGIALLASLLLSLPK
ncbi:MAG: hypothetical protein ABI725_05650 [Chloroflexota bacterium]